jgi:hypothetical protein
MKARLIPFALGALLVASWLPALASDAVPPPAQASEQATEAAPPSSENAAPLVKMELEPKAIDILKAASSRLAAAHSMKFTATISYESPSRLGPPLMFTTRSEVTMERPNKLRVVTPGDGPATEFYYDGSAIMALAPAENLVAVAEAPSTLDEALAFAYQHAGIYFPFSDLVVDDPYASLADSLNLAFYIGQSDSVGGTKTDMIAFANDDVFVQIWIGTEDKLPRRMRASYLNDPLQLRHQMDLTDWELNPCIKPDTFASAQASTASPISFQYPSLKLSPLDKPSEQGKPANPQ